MSLLLDHVALFCDLWPTENWRSKEQAGFCADSGWKHDGQGTSNRVVQFEPNYLELIMEIVLNDASALRGIAIGAHATLI